MHLKGIGLGFFWLNECLARESLFIASSVAKEWCWWVCLPGSVGVFVAGLLETICKA